MAGARVTALASTSTTCARQPQDRRPSEVVVHALPQPELVGRPVATSSASDLRDLIVALGEQFPGHRAGGPREQWPRHLPAVDRCRGDQHWRGSAADDPDRHRDLPAASARDSRPPRLARQADRRRRGPQDRAGQRHPVGSGRGALRLVAVDVGLAGILRRLGLSGPGERLARLHLEAEKYIEWDDVDRWSRASPASSCASSRGARTLIRRMWRTSSSARGKRPASWPHSTTSAQPTSSKSWPPRAGRHSGSPLPGEADILEEMGPDEAADLVRRSFRGASRRSPSASWSPRRPPM